MNPAFLQIIHKLIKNWPQLLILLLEFFCDLIGHVHFLFNSYKNVPQNDIEQLSEWKTNQVMRPIGWKTVTFLRILVPLTVKDIHVIVFSQFLCLFGDEPNAWAEVRF